MSNPDYAKIWSDSYISRKTPDNQYEKEEEARRYDLSEKIWEDGYKRACEFSFEKTDTVLDIGCGPG